MSNLHRFNCPYCHKRTEFEIVDATYPLKMICCHCYKPVIQLAKNQNVEKRQEPTKQAAFLIHSSKQEDKHLLNWVRTVFGLYGVLTRIVEEDSRPVDFLQKSKDGIEQADFVVVLLTKRYQYIDDSGKLKWKSSDKCYDEIAMSFMRGRDIFALIEKTVDPGRVLERLTWYGTFEYKQNEISIENAAALFQTLEMKLGNAKPSIVVVYKS